MHNEDVPIDSTIIPILVAAQCYAQILGTHAAT